MSRVQLALNVSDIDTAVDFYTKLFGTEPAKRQPGYANFVIADPPLKLVLIENPAARGEGVTGALNHLGVAQAFAQAVAEIRALTGWLLGQGCPSVALSGISLGGWFAGLAATRDARLNAIVMAVPAVRTNYRVARGERILWPPVRKALERRQAAREALDKTPINLTLSQPFISKENILLVQGRYDLFVEPEHTEELWQKWGQPEIWRLPHGHISTVLTPGMTGHILRWLSPRLNGDMLRTLNK